ncbi:hypothetical protein [Rhizobium sp. TRM95796]|uniref:hypothetical protein n=1 Tax=Rhizobium sp. TRM95796 TaxID=2979862 RepID=UPI0021E7F5D3|nr:hypothetical protein [Rhizobium sp. TRM95796]MCV3765130.1 hypothetical protein [Rhizobium sp. TRM95796]
MAYVELRHAGAEAVFACDGGGFPLVAGHMRQFSDDPVIAGFLADHTARSDIAEALGIDQIVINDFDMAVFFPIDAADLGPASGLMRAFLDHGKTVVIPDGLQPDHGPQPSTIIRTSATDLDWLRQLTA